MIWILDLSESWISVSQSHFLSKKETLGNSKNYSRISRLDLCHLFIAKDTGLNLKAIFICHEWLEGTPGFICHPPQHTSLLICARGCWLSLLEHSFISFSCGQFFTSPSVTTPPRPSPPSAEMVQPLLCAGCPGRRAGLGAGMAGTGTTWGL